MISKDKEHPIKKAAMMIYWRTQQIAQIFSMIMLALTLTLTVNLYIEWRFSNSYIGMVITLFVLAAIILFAGYAWDKKLRMWHEQNVVSVERNPFNMHKLTPKEIAQLKTLWLPFFKDAGGESAKNAIKWEIWCEDQMTKDPNLRISVDELMKQHFDVRGE